MIAVTFAEAKSGFFDRSSVIDAVDRAQRKTLSRFGAFVRQRARTSIKKRRGISRPGEPPSSHTGLLKRGILFSYDASAKSVVIGPALLRAGSRAPALLERGGRDGERRDYRARPFMGPAFAAEMVKLDDLWQNSVR